MIINMFDELFGNANGGRVDNTPIKPVKPVKHVRKTLFDTWFEEFNEMVEQAIVEEEKKQEMLKLSQQNKNVDKQLNEKKQNGGNRRMEKEFYDVYKDNDGNLIFEIQANDITQEDINITADLQESHLNIMFSNHSKDKYDTKDYLYKSIAVQSYFNASFFVDEKYDLTKVTSKLLKSKSLLRIIVPLNKDKKTDDNIIKIEVD